MKKTILVDLDGVLNKYKGQFNENYIPPIKEGAFNFLKKLSQNYIVKIFTTRQMQIASEWVNANNINTFVAEITNRKEPAYLIIDDRCIKFDGDYEKTLEKIKNFKVWYK